MHRMCMEIKSGHGQTFNQSQQPLLEHSWQKHGILSTVSQHMSGPCIYKNGVIPVSLAAQAQTPGIEVYDAN